MNGPMLNRIDRFFYKGCEIVVTTRGTYMEISVTKNGESRYSRFPLEARLKRHILKDMKYAVNSSVKYFDTYAYPPF